MWEASKGAQKRNPLSRINSRGRLKTGSCQKWGAGTYEGRIPRALLTLKTLVSQEPSISIDIRTRFLATEPFLTSTPKQVNTNLMRRLNE